MLITPQAKTNRLAEAIGLPTDLYFKREDLGTYGSHKGRSIPVMIEKYTKTGTYDFVISSSGNAALAAALYVKEYNKKNPLPISLKIFVGKNINKEKLANLAKLGDKNIIIEQTTNPKQNAFQMEKIDQAKNLRQSTDDTALLGYEKMAEELGDIQNLTAVFIPTSSGTTAEGLYNGFKKMGLKPQIHIVQSQACHPIADDFRQSDETLTIYPSIASAIVDKVAHRKKQVVEIIKKTGGDAWIPSDQEILEAMKLVRDTENIEISPNSALAVAGLIQAIKSGKHFNGPVACLITGK